MPNKNSIAGVQQSESLSSRRHVLKSLALTTVGCVSAGVGVNALAPIAVPEDLIFEPNLSFWAKSLPPPNDPLTTDLVADVVVIGGGFTGLSAGYFLRKSLPGKRVVLLEARTCGNGASGRNGAMVLNLTDNSYMQWSGDPSTDRRLYDLTAKNIQFLRALSKETGIDCELEQNGALQVLTSPADASDAKQFAQQSRAAGFPFEFWSKERTAQAIGTTAYHGALFDPLSGQVHPGKLVAVWKTAAIKAGVEIFESTPVIAVEEGAVLRLTTAGGQSVRAPQLVLATNAYSSKLGYLRNAVAPVFDYVGITPVLSDAQLRAAGWNALIPFNDNRTEVYYAGLTRDRRIHFGGGPVDYSFNNGVRVRQDAASRFANLNREFSRVFPSLSGVEFEMKWSGSVDMSLDGSPAVGRMSRNRNVYYGIGFSGHGVNLTSVFGRIIADLVTGKGDRWSWLPFLNRLPPYIPNEPFRWLAVNADLAFIRLTEGGL